MHMCEMAHTVCCCECVVGVVVVVTTIMTIMSLVAGPVVCVASVLVSAVVRFVLVCFGVTRKVTMADAVVWCSHLQWSAVCMERRQRHASDVTPPLLLLPSPCARARACAGASRFASVCWGACTDH